MSKAFHCETLRLPRRMERTWWRVFLQDHEPAIQFFKSHGSNRSTRIRTQDGFEMATPRPLNGSVRLFLLYKSA